MQFSVVIPTCNRNQQLAICLDRLKPGIQTLEHSAYEVIVTDDSKNFEARNFIRNNYPWVHYINGPQKGPAANRNMGAKYAKGEWIVFLDDDCLPDGKILQAYKEAMSKYKSLVFEGCIRNDHDSNNPLEHAPLNINGGNLWSCNFCINKYLFTTLKGFDEKFIYPHMEDADLKKRLEENQCSIVFIRDAFVVHPWRIISNGFKLGKYQEMNIYFHRKYQLRFDLVHLLKSVLSVHWSMLKRKPFSLNHIIAIKVALEHLVVILINYKSWNKKYVAGY